jgi:glycosyltransferase involved in cell wall biosynthesis
MGGVQRVVSLASHLTRLGWNVSVLTVKPFAFPAVDRSLLKRVPESVTVYRAAVPSAEKFKLMFSRNDAKPGAELSSTGSEIARWAMLPDSKVISLPNLLTLIPDVIRKSHPSVVLTSSPPPSIHLAGAYAKKRFGLRWVADFRDVWFPQSQIDFRTPLHRKLQSHLERTYVKKCDAVVAVSARHVEMLREKYAEWRSKVHHVPNGFEEADFKSDAPEAATGPISIGYCGTLNHLTYIKALFEQLAEIAEKQPMTIDILGVVTGSVKQSVEEIDTDRERIRLHGSREHSEAIRFVRSRDINLITLAANARLESAIPGKAYEILRAERPAIAVLPKESAAWELLSRFDNVLMVNAADVPACKQQISEFIQRSRTSMPVRKGIEEFDWNNLAQRYDGLLERVVG